MEPPPFPTSPGAWRRGLRLETALSQGGGLKGRCGSLTYTAEIAGGRWPGLRRAERASVGGNHVRARGEDHSSSTTKGGRRESKH